MIIYGVESGTLNSIAQALDMELDNIRPQGKGIAFKLNPTTSRAQYARSSAPMNGRPGRKLKAVCYHGFREFIFRVFDAGATRVKSAGDGNDWGSRFDFSSSLDRLADMNVGSTYEPARMADLCNCQEDE